MTVLKKDLKNGAYYRFVNHSTNYFKFIKMGKNKEYPLIFREPSGRQLEWSLSVLEMITPLTELEYFLEVL